MRIDRAITLYAARPLRAAWSALRSPISGPSPGSRCLPILMYHSISEDPEFGFGDYYRVCTAPARFADHIQLMADWGYRGVTLAEGLSWLGSADAGSGVMDPCEKLVAITFDDGYQDNLSEALPVLQRHGFSATIYLATDYIAADGQRRSFKNRPCLTWDEVRALDRAGVELGSHTLSHPKLADLPHDEARREFLESKSRIESELQKPVTAFAQPYAFPSHDKDYVRRYRALMAEAGYTSGVTTILGRAAQCDDRLSLRRLPANQADDSALLRAKLIGDYDWVSAVQQSAKALRARRYRSPRQHA